MRARSKRLYVIGVFLFFISIFLVQFDKPLSDWLHFGSHTWNFALQKLTQVGDGRILITVCMGIFGSLLMRRARSLVHIPILAIVSFAFSGMVTQLLKVLTGRPRPYLADDIHNAHMQFDIFYWFNNDKDFSSFPSGHTTAVFSVAWMLSFLPIGRLGRSLLFITATLVALSRVALGKHFFADVLAGAIIGILSSQLIMDLWTKKGNRLLFCKQRANN